MRAAAGFAGYESVALFAERAAQVDPDFTLTPASGSAVATIVQRLDGMPLAIELAAAQVDTLGLDQLVAGLDDRFRVLVSGTRGVVARQASLAATVEWSYRLLGESEQRAFRRLSVFPAAFTLDAARAAVGSDAVMVVARLVRRSLLVAPRAGPDGQFRYRMLETLRAYASARLDESGDARRDGRGDRGLDSVPRPNVSAPASKPLTISSPGGGAMRSRTICVRCSNGCSSTITRVGCACRSR